MDQRVTIEDIAAEAGVSRTTVTRAMNGMPRISEKTRSKVLEASERLGYRPSRFAANLARSSKARAIGFVVDSFRNPYYTELTAELLGTAAARGWQMTVLSHEQAPQDELLRRISQDVDVIVGYLSGNESEIAAAARGVPVVLIGEEATHPALHSVAIDFDRGLAALVEGLRARGSRRFGLLESHATGALYEPSSRRLAYGRHVDELSKGSVVVCDAGFQSVDAGIDGFRRLVAEHPETDTVIAFSDLMAMGALVAAHEADIAVPGDVRIVGIDGISLGAVTYPALSSLAIVDTELATVTAGLIDRILSGESRDGERLSITPRPLWRGTA
ncbi:LacI family transcriptional regulator [Promicromonospora sp. AC04]|uniref:LacI family DNA-binding transcriptional regulator n=1 Tax=Promicromonospora sp. AC04 TaxID=2135723 RepID=UPI000D3FADC2|nr:LacI family DNA-binding transcriptional regulator [Promicromonospora sp. AC04]PUB27594.1 LacI family transcriptional regulator [Promicromonospora sp. AC04]